MKKLLLIALIISGISGVAHAQQNQQDLALELAKTSQPNPAPAAVEANQEPLTEGLTKKEIKGNQEDIRKQAESKELLRYWKFSDFFLGTNNKP